MSSRCLQRDVLDQIKDALLAGGRCGEHVEGRGLFGRCEATGITRDGAKRFHQRAITVDRTAVIERVALNLIQRRV